MTVLERMFRAAFILGCETQDKTRVDELWAELRQPTTYIEPSQGNKRETHSA